MTRLLVLILLLCSPRLAYLQVLHVGGSYPYPTLDAALQDVTPGDTIRIHEGTYSGGLYEENVQGTAQAWITIEAAPGEVVIFEGGTNAWQFTDAAYLHIQGMIFQHQTGNGLNFDDGGTYDTPAHHVHFSDCTFRDMSASGNNDMLKLSGLDSFEIRQCAFLNGAEGGSGIDMVGCHDGTVVDCEFRDQGSNCIQMKGGTRNIVVERIFFKNGGQRTLNIGGSTDLQFFRPLDATYEAADIKVYANVFIGSIAPVAFVGCINSEVVNNTIYLPNKWVLRILQETVDTTRFATCGNNAFINNIIYIDNQVTVECNIGPNTDPQSFMFFNNLWFHSEDIFWTGPVLPVTDVDAIFGSDPFFRDAENEDFSLLLGSLAIRGGKEVDQPIVDYILNNYNHPRSIGAYEGEPASAVHDLSKSIQPVTIYPNPTSGKLTIVIPEMAHDDITISIISRAGQVMNKFNANTDISGLVDFDPGHLAPGLYYVLIQFNGGTFQSSFIIK
jgi:hypothetical protein